MPSATPRRKGTTDSATRARLLDAAEALLVEKGYAAVTSRRVAAAAGLKPQLVHYYFHSMEELFTEVFRRNAERNLARFEEVIAAGVTLETLWELHAGPRGAEWIVDFAALAKHHPPIRAEIARHAERFRAVQLQTVASALSSAGIGEDELPPMVVLLAITGLAQLLSLERDLGMTAGHDETVAYVRRAIADLQARADARGGQHAAGDGDADGNGERAPAAAPRTGRGTTGRGTTGRGATGRSARRPGPPRR